MRPGLDFAIWKVIRCIEFPAVSERDLDLNLTRPLMTSHKPGDASDGQREYGDGKGRGREELLKQMPPPSETA